jgi:RecA-family ATPase
MMTERNVVSTTPHTDGWTVVSHEQLALREDHTPGYLVPVPTSSIPLDGLSRLLVNFDPNCSRDEWRDVGMALHYETGGSEEGLLLWDGWSQKATRIGSDGRLVYWGLDHLKSQWLSFKDKSDNPGRRLITGAYLLARNVATPDEFDIEGVEVSAVRAYSPVLNAVRATIGSDTFRTPQTAPQFLIPGFLPLEIGGVFGAGGMSKTTLMLVLAIHLILGRALWGFPIERRGKVLVLSAEDGIKRMRYRLYHIGQALGLNDDEMKEVGAGLYVEDLTGHNARLVEADARSNLSQTRFVNEVIDTYKDFGIVLVVIDPTVYFGPGERFINDGEAAIAQVAARFRREMGCAVALVHHVGKANARGKVSDQYAGRGGSALSDGLRWIWTLVTHTKDEGDFKAPLAVPAEALREGRLLRLHIAKLTDAPISSEPIWLVRNGFNFDRVMPQADAVEDRRELDIQRICSFLRQQKEQGVRYSASSLEDEVKRIGGIGRNELRSLVREGVQRGILAYRDLPKAEQRGGLKQFLDPADGSDDYVDVAVAE